jgi:hypothetical protein
MTVERTRHWRGRRARRRAARGSHAEAWEGELTRALALRPRAPAGAPRVVFIPGLLGSFLIDTSLTPQQAKDLCAKNMGAARRAVRGGALDPCDKGPERLWDGVGCLHWLFNPPEWEARMRRGNGYDAPGAVRPGGLFEAEVRLRRRTFSFKPYAGFVAALRSAGADVLVFPYDWRLGCHYNAAVLQRAILARWFGGRYLERGRPLSEAERIIFIGHSFGGLVARYFLESPHLGRDLARHLVTIGTAHLGAPQTWLHFVGRTLPFPENPFYKWASDALSVQLAAMGAQAGTVGAQFLPARTQTAVLQHMASAVELLPVYDFVVDRGRPEPFAQTYAGAVHKGTGKPATTVIETFRKNLVAAARLDAWLRQHGLHYHFLGAANFPTASGFDRTRDQIVMSRNGDGTVPLPSAHLMSKSTARLSTVLLTQDPRGHQSLCMRGDVQAYCIKLLRPAAPVRRAAPPVRPSAAGRPAATQESPHIVAARAILARDNWDQARGEVMCLAHLWSNDGKTLLDPTVQGGQLKNPPRHLSGATVHTITAGGRTFRFVWILPNVSVSRPGGVAFLPDPGASKLTLVTLNVERLDRDFRRSCGNEHHAENQLVGFIRAQPLSWQLRLGLLQLYNRSRKGPNLGYSACSACCQDLASLLKWLNGMSGRNRKVRPSISWERLYDKRAACGHPTTLTAIRMMIAAGWDPPQGPWPVTRPAPSPVRRRRPTAPARTP